MRHAVALTLLLTGCVTTQATLVDPTARPHPAVLASCVRIFMAASELDSLDYVRIALIEASGSGEYTSQTGMIEAMRQKAGKLGANAILMPQIQEPGAGAKVAAAIFGMGTQRKGTVVALRVLGIKGGAREDPTREAACRAPTDPALDPAKCQQDLVTGRRTRCP